MRKTLLIGIGIALLTFACGTPLSTVRTVKFSPKNDEITTTPSLKEYLSTNPKPKIVLRTSARLNSDNVTEKEQNNYLYNTIESELLKSGFIVRDRQLFEKIVTNSDNNTNYENLKQKSDTDLIIELTNLDRSIIYQTNTYSDENGKEKTSSMLATKIFYGATIEFKVIMIETNEFAGIYKFNYVPCVDGCETRPAKRLTKRELDERTIESYEAVEEDKLIEFTRNATRQLISEMRN
ncbi:hypothetical protein ESY86_20240 [Subsaximicrobium wynnwilliamsii]|uniref:Lipoprotein n=1 Tax=Subsaximicrobium wynnwilliamsii TaxID=291179 RepID=A0A5C6ZBQ2_9FLAO|nr:hypothetical protein [Subsaximicrobium wynnwilliamsii]TXD80685.1 hypothetical protein ESY87_20390 [Subsaximicrobium wynnwilliamsii]TXD86427.1 hypothetical protein ESY86_20240 [Subsaximicrobium wynnwilliamsii]TXD99896.1 hypothetical protein ESY88_20335 [Subsaximicrobium wynnwilliamsii]